MNPKVTYTDANANSFSDKILRWELMAAKLAPLLDSMPHIKPVYDGFVQLATDAKNLEFQAKSLRTAASKTAEDRRGMVLSGDRLRSRLTSALAFENGPTSVELKEFGIRPRVAGKRRTKTVPAPVPVPVPTPQPEIQPATHSAVPATESGGGSAAK